MNLSLGQSAWNDIFSRFGSLVRIWIWLREYVQWKMIQERDAGSGPYSFPYNKATPQDWKEDGPTIVLKPRRYSVTTATLPSVYNFILNGIKIGTNTDLMGMLFAKIAMNGGNTQATVSIYKDSAESSKVAEGTGVPGSITLAEQNSSGITGSCYFESVFGASNIEDYILIVRPDWQSRLKSEFNSQTTEDGRLLSVFLDFLSSNANTISGMISDWESLIETEFISTFLKTKMQSPSSDILVATQVQSGGTITIEYAGILKNLSDNMEDDSTPQTIRKNTNTASVAIANSGNIGIGTISISLYEHARAGRVTLVCIDETIGSEAFEVKFRPTDWWELSDLSALYHAYVTKTFLDNDIGISSLVISRTISETGDGSNKYSNWVINGETASNTDDGSIYSKYDLALQKLYFYKSIADRSAEANEIASADLSGGGFPKTCAITAENSSGLSGSVDVASEPADNYEVTIDLQVFKLNDSFTFTIAQSDTGLIQRFIGNRYHFDLPSAGTLDGETIKDNYARRG